MTSEQIADLIAAKTAELLTELDISGDIVVDVVEVEDRKFVETKITADDAAELIGKHGSRLQDLANILNLFLPESAREYSVIVDVNGYREERAGQVRQIAQRNIEHAALTATEVHLDPMPAWERRLVHMEAQDRTDVTTESAGQGADRYVVIKPISVV